MCVATGTYSLGLITALLLLIPTWWKRNNASFPPVFTNLSVNGINMMPSDKDSPLTVSCLYSKEIRLSHGIPFVVEFSSFNYSDAGTNQIFLSLGEL